MKKSILFLLTLAFLFAAVAGCNQEENSGETLPTEKVIVAFFSACDCISEEKKEDVIRKNIGEIPPEFDFSKNLKIDETSVSGAEYDLEKAQKIAEQKLTEAYKDTRWDEAEDKYSDFTLINHNGSPYLMVRINSELTLGEHTSHINHFIFLLPPEIVAIPPSA